MGKALWASVATLALGGAAAVSIGFAPGAAAASTYQGCPSGAVCIYPQNTGFNGGHPESNGVFFSYTGHNLSNQYGAHKMVNNQTGDAGFGLCKGYGGSGGFAKTTPIVAEEGQVPYSVTVQLSPVNSVDLRPVSQFESVCKR